MKSVAIIGAGITGLTTAFYLKRRGVPVALYEGSDRVGGVIQSSRRDGFLSEAGPNTLLETSPKIAQLVLDADLAARRLDTNPAAEARFVVRYGRPIQMPSSPPGFLGTKLFSLSAKLTVLREPFIKPRRDGVEESIGQFVVRRFNQEFLDQAIDALVAGIYAGDPDKLSLTHGFPRLKALEDKYGSMIKGQILGARDRKKSGEVAKDRAPKFSFDEGLQVLPDALATQLGEAVKLNTPVTRLIKTGDDWRVTIPGGEAEHCAVVYCGTAYRLAKLEIISGGQVPELSAIGGYPLSASGERGAGVPEGRRGARVQRIRDVDSQDRGLQDSRHNFFIGLVSKSRARRARFVDELCGRRTPAGTRRSAGGSTGGLDRGADLRVTFRRSRRAGFHAMRRVAQGDSAIQCGLWPFQGIADAGGDGDAGTFFRGTISRRRLIG